MGILSTCQSSNIDIDRYLNRIVAPSPLHRFPTLISRFLGYRKDQRQDVGNVLGAFWSLVGAFCGLAVVVAVFNNTGSIQRRHPPTLIASFGASAVLEYNAIRSPLGQPRNALLGHTFSALIGVSISKLFQYHTDYDSIKWLAGALACGIASAIMLLTNTVHPPGGASAVLAATEPVVTAMGWYFVGLVMWGTTLMLGVGLLVNNVQRQFPVYWWTPLDVRRAKRRNAEAAMDVKGAVEWKGNMDEQSHGEIKERIEINGASVRIPKDLSLNGEEVEVLQNLRERLRKRRDESDKTTAKDGEVSRSSADFTMVHRGDEVDDIGKSRSNSSSTASSEHTAV